jgi:hypothetical protein
MYSGPTLSEQAIHDERLSPWIVGEWGGWGEDEWEGDAMKWAVWIWGSTIDSIVSVGRQLLVTGSNLCTTDGEILWSRHFKSMESQM